MADTIGTLEMAVLAAQTRANIARLRAFVTFEAADETALDRVGALLGDFVKPFESATPTSAPTAATPRQRSSPFPAAGSVPAIDPQVAAAEDAAKQLRTAHPQHASRMAALVWKGLSGGVHIFKHNDTGRTLAFDPVSKRVSCTVVTGETSFEPSTVFSEVGTL